MRQSAILSGKDRICSNFHGKRPLRPACRHKMVMILLSLDVDAAACGLFPIGTDSAPSYKAAMNPILLILILLILFGGGGFYLGGPVFGGGSIGLILLIVLAIYFFGGFRSRN